MATIIYGVCGEGHGHAARSLAIIQHLKKKHTVHVVGSAKSYKLLSKIFPVLKIDYLKIIYVKNKAAYVLTALNNIMRLPKIIKQNNKLARFIKQKKPDIIISDFEPFTVRAANKMNIPLLAIDNQHALLDGKHKFVPKSAWLDFSVTKLVIRSIVPKADDYLVLSMQHRATQKGKYKHIPFPIRDGLRKKRPQKDHILVYQTSDSDDQLLPTLSKFPDQDFIVYGRGICKPHANVHCKEVNTTTFYDDLVTAKAVITNGGVGLLSESVFLHKPILTIPVKRQFEQVFNALHVQHLGYGMYAKDMNVENMQKFLKHMPKLKQSVQKYPQYTNKEIFESVDKAIKSLS